MSLENIFKKLTLQGEELILQQKTIPENPTFDERDNAISEWVDIQKLVGMVQKDSKIPNGAHGVEEIPDYIGYFKPNFTIKPEEFEKFRIKHVFPTETQNFIRYFRIKGFNRNLRLNQSLHHYEIMLELDF